MKNNLFVLFAVLLAAFLLPCNAEALRGAELLVAREDLPTPEDDEFYVEDMLGCVILLQLLIGSILMVCLGIIGYYIAKIYEEIKDRPRYIVAERCEGQQDEGQAEKDI